MNSTSLDDILREIEREKGPSQSSTVPTQSAGLEDLPTHEVGPKRSNSSPFLVPEMIGQVPQLTHEMVGGGKAFGQNAMPPSELSERQKRLPKISARMLGGIAAVMVLMVGLGSSVLLSQQSQDVRQQAYQGSMLPDVEEEAGVAEMETPSQVGEEATSQPVEGGEAVQTAPSEVSQMPLEAPFWQQPAFIAGVAVVISAILILFVFLHWLFAV